LGASEHPGMASTKATGERRWVIVVLLLKEEIVEMLKDNGDVVTAQQAEAKLPDEVDTDADGELLRKEGINIKYLLSRRSEPQ
jgi:hypothetical protein